MWLSISLLRQSKELTACKRSSYESISEFVRKKASRLSEMVLIYAVYVSVHFWMLRSLCAFHNFMGKPRKGLLLDRFSLWHLHDIRQCPLKPGMAFCICGPNLILNRGSLWVRFQNQAAGNKQGLARALLIFRVAFYLKVPINYSGTITECYNLGWQKQFAPLKKLSCLLFSSPCFPVPAPADAHVAEIKHNRSHGLVTYIKTPAIVTSWKWHFCNT